MRLELIAVATAAALALPPVTLAAAAESSLATRSAQASPSRAAAADSSPSSSKPAKSRPRNPTDRSASDPGAATFTSFDLDKDGYVSRDEARESAELTRQFKAIDKDGDGKLSLRELTGWRNSSYPALSSATDSQAEKKR